MAHIEGNAHRERIGQLRRQRGDGDELGAFLRVEHVGVIGEDDILVELEGIVRGGEDRDAFNRFRGNDHIVFHARLALVHFQAGPAFHRPDGTPAIEHLIAETAAEEEARVETGELVDLVGDAPEAVHPVIHLAVDLAGDEGAVLGLLAIGLAEIGLGLDTGFPDLGLARDVDGHAEIGGLGIPGRDPGAEAAFTAPFRGIGHGGEGGVKQAG